MVTRYAERRSVGPDYQLFLLRLCCLDVLQLVLSISVEGKRAGSQGKRVLFDAALSCHARGLPSGWVDQRPPDEIARPTGRAVRNCGAFDLRCRHLHRLRDASAECPPGECCPRRWRRRALLVSEFFLLRRP